MFTLSPVTSPFARMGIAQRIAAVALLALALIAAMALVTGGGRHAGSAHPSSGFSPASYAGASASPSGGSGSSAAAHGDGASALPTVTLDSLPAEARTTVRLIDAGGPFPYPRDGIIFSNTEHLLPAHPRGWYHEYTVKTPGVSSRGVRRIITGKDGTLYYTGDHYRSFERVRR